jgi:hypothetical protein
VVSSHLILCFKISRFRHISPLKFHTSFLFPHPYYAPSPSEAPTFHFHVTTAKWRIKHYFFLPLILSVSYLAMLPASGLGPV